MLESGVHCLVVGFIPLSGVGESHKFNQILFFLNGLQLLWYHQVVADGKIPPVSAPVTQYTVSNLYFVDSPSWIM
jgi:hypothetical protein